MAPKVSAITLYPIKSCHYINVDSCEVDELGLKLDRRFMFVDESTGRFITQRKYASMTLIHPVVDKENGTLTLTAEGFPSVSVPLFPDVTKLAARKAQLWKDTLTVFDLGDEAAAWITNFFKANRKHDLENDHNPDEAVKPDEFRNIRLVTLDDPNNGRYARPAHGKLPGIHSPFSDWSPISFGFEASLDDLNKGLVEKANGRSIPINRFRNNLTISGTKAWEEDDWLVVKIGEVTFYVIRPIARCTVPSIDQDTGVKDEWGSVLSYLKAVRHFDEKPNDGFFCVDVAPLTRGTIHVGDEVEILERVPKKKE